MNPDLLSGRTRAVLNEIRRHIEEQGYPPTIREIRDATGISSVSVVSHHLEKLETRGFIQREPNKVRAIRLIGGQA